MYIGYNVGVMPYNALMYIYIGYNLFVMPCNVLMHTNEEQTTLFSMHLSIWALRFISL